MKTFRAVLLIKTLKYKCLCFSSAPQRCGHRSRAALLSLLALEKIPGTSLGALGGWQYPGWCQHWNTHLRLCSGSLECLEQGCDYFFPELKVHALIMFSVHSNLRISQNSCTLLFYQHKEKTHLKLFWKENNSIFVIHNWLKFTKNSVLKSVFFSSNFSLTYKTASCYVLYLPFLWDLFSGTNREEVGRKKNMYCHVQTKSYDLYWQDNT